MSDDRLLAALARLGHEELPSATDRQIRARLETAWTTRARAVAAPLLSFRRFAPVLAALVVAAGLGGASLGAGADSPLWDTRVALEDAAAFLRTSTDDRVAYLLDLVQSRTEEAARQEAAGHPDAAAKARAASAAAVVELDGNLPQIDTSTPAPVVSASPSPSPSAANSPSPSRSPIASGSPAVQLPPTATPPPTPVRTFPPTSTPVRTDPPTPKPSPTPTRAPMTITGIVRDASGANVTGACLSTSPTFPTSTTACSVKTTNGVYGISGTWTPGVTITLYAYWMNSTSVHYSASASATIVYPTTVMPPMTLTQQK